MGCCLSSDRAPQPANPVMEEETVKEVMSETPNIPRQYPSSRVRENGQIESPFIKIAPLLDFSRAVHDRKQQNGAVWKKPPFAAEFGNEELSEDVSEIGSSLSESMSASKEKRGNELRELRQRSPAKSKSRSLSAEVRRERTVGRSPGRRSELPANRAMGSGYGRKRDCGESSGRRSRSPVTRLEPPTPVKPGLVQSQSARKTGRSPGRVGSGLGERTRKLEEDSKWPPTSNNELLENPLVSLECFIFL